MVVPSLIRKFGTCLVSHARVVSTCQNLLFTQFETRNCNSVVLSIKNQAATYKESGKCGGSTDVADLPGSK